MNYKHYLNLPVKYTLSKINTQSNDQYAAITSIFELGKLLFISEGLDKAVNEIVNKGLTPGGLIPLLPIIGLSISGYFLFTALQKITDAKFHATASSGLIDKIYDRTRDFIDLVHKKNGAKKIPQDKSRELSYKHTKLELVKNALFIGGSSTIFIGATILQPGVSFAGKILMYSSVLPFGQQRVYDRQYYHTATNELAAETMKALDILEIGITEQQGYTENLETLLLKEQLKTGDFKPEEYAKKEM